MTVLRELIARIKLDARAATSSLKKYDKLLDDTKAKTEGVTEETEKFGDETEEAAGKAQNSGKKIVKTWKQIGNEVKKQAKKTKDNLAPLATSVGAVAAAAAAGGLAVVEFSRQWSSSVDEMGKRAAGLNVPVKALQELSFVAKVTGASGEDIDDTFKEIQVRLGEAAETGTGAFADAAKILKLDLDELSEKSPVEVFEKLRDELGKVEDQNLRLFLSEELLGEGGAKLANLVKLTTKEFNALKTEAGELGGVMSGEAFEAAAALNAEFTRSETVVAGIKNEVAEGLAPEIQGLLKDFRAWAKENRDLIRTNLTKFLGQLVTTLRELGPLAVKALNLFIETNEAVGGLTNSVKLLAGAFIALKLAALGPIGAIAGGFIALGLAVDAYTTKLRNAAQAEDKLAQKKTVTAEDRAAVSKTADGRAALADLDAAQKTLNRTSSAESNLDQRDRETGDEFSGDQAREDAEIRRADKKKRKDALAAKALATRNIKALLEIAKLDALDAADAKEAARAAASADEIPLLKKTPAQLRAERRAEREKKAPTKSKKKKDPKESALTIGELLGVGPGGAKIEGTTKGLGTTIVNQTFNIGLPSIRLEITAARGATVRDQAVKVAEAVVELGPNIVKQTQRAVVGQLS